MKTRFTMIVAVIATFAISLNLHSSNEEVVFGAPAMQMPRGGALRCAYNQDVNDCIWTYNGTVCIDLPGRSEEHTSELHHSDRSRMPSSA